jgi:hypothetical protein
MSKPTTPPGAVEMNGRKYLANARGDLVAVDNIKATDLLMDELVRKLVGYAEDLSAELARFQVHTFADIAAFDALLAQEYNVSRPEDLKGNRTFTSFNGTLQVKIRVGDRLILGPELQIAKKLLDAMIQERSEGADPFLITLVNQAFKVDQEGKVDVHSILALRRMDVPDPRWAEVTRAIDDATRVIGTKQYVNFYRRSSPTGRWEMVPLDMAAVQPSSDAFERRGLRRSQEDALEKLQLGLTYLFDGAPVTAAERFADAVEALGGKRPEDDLAAWRKRFGIDLPVKTLTPEPAQS